MKTKPSKFRTQLATLVHDGVFTPAYWVGAFAFMILLHYYLWFSVELNLPTSRDPAVWGQFGDYVGGILNPVCAYMAFIWLVRSYALQKTELAETRKSLEAGQKAQQEQARLALVSAQTQSLSIRLSAAGSTLSALRQSHARAVEHANQRGLEFAVVADDGTLKPAKEAIPNLYALIKIAEKVEDNIIAELNKISLHENETAVQLAQEVSTQR